MKRFILSFVAIVSLGSFLAWGANYTVTQGLGTTFGSLVVGGVNYAQQAICDPTTPSQCASVSAGGAITEANSASILAAVQAGTGTIAAAVPSAAVYNGINVSGNLRGATGVNPTGSVFATQQDITSWNGVTLALTNPIPVTPRTPTGLRSATVSGTSAISAQAIAAQGSGVRFAMTDFSCSNSGSSGTVVHFLDGNAAGALPIWTSIVPASGGTNKSFQTPVSTTANTALIISTLTASTTVYCNVSGYPGT